MNITIGRYVHGDVPVGGPVDQFGHRLTEARDVADTWECWVEDEARTWIMFIPRDGEPTVWLDRDPESGAVVGEPLCRAPGGC